MGGSGDSVVTGEESDPSPDLKSTLDSWVSQKKNHTFATEASNNQDSQHHTPEV